MARFGTIATDIGQPEALDANAVKALAEALGFFNEASDLQSATFWNAPPQAIMTALQSLQNQQLQDQQLSSQEYQQGMRSDVERERIKAQKDLGYAGLGSKEKIAKNELAAKQAMQQAQFAQQMGLQQNQQAFQRDVIPAAKGAEIEATKGLKAATLGYQLQKDQRQAQQYQQTESRKEREFAQKQEFNQQNQQRLEYQNRLKMLLSIMNPATPLPPEAREVLMQIAVNPAQTNTFVNRLGQVGLEQTLAEAREWMLSKQQRQKK